MRARHLTAWLLIVAFGALIAAFALHRLPLPSLAALVAREHALAAYGAAHPLRLAALFVIAYVVIAPLPLPGAELVTIAAGALFGLAESIALVSFAATLGSCAAFLLGRYLFRDGLGRHLDPRFAVMARNIEREGPFYLFALRMIPMAPFFIINILLGATPLKLTTFAWVSQLGVLPTIIAYANAGRQVGHLASVSAVFSPGMFAAFAALGLLPLVTRRVIGWRRRGYPIAPPPRRKTDPAGILAPRVGLPQVSLTRENKRRERIIAGNATLLRSGFRHWC
ncbi:MAG TPA: TVP38/TMEM64 family protein [Acetobacteraceae bacterium]|nr:TVP38/TMEM64 family protein [Acetobacteraceae bacterium]